MNTEGVGDLATGRTGPGHMPESRRCVREEVQRDFFLRVMERAERAMRSRGAVSLHLELAGVTIRLDFAGPAMVQAPTAALQHRLVAPPTGPVDAVFKIWDSVSTGIENVPPPWKSTDYCRRGDIWGFNSSRYLSSFHWNEYALNLFDSETQTGIYWRQDAARIPYRTKAAPLRPLFHWSLQSRGLQLIPGAAVGTADGALLLAGHGRRGKSSTVLSCLLAGLQYLGDEVLVVEHDPHPRVHGLYGTAVVNWDDLRHFPGLEDHLLPGADREDGRAGIALSPAFAPQLARSLPLCLMVTPRFHEQARTELASVSEDLSRGAVTLDTISLLPHGGQQAYRFIRDLARKVPLAALALGRDRSAIPERVAAIVRSPGKPPADTSKVRPRSKDLPLITVIIPVFNGSRFLHEVVECVEAQNYASLEVIVVDDGSTDDIEAAVRDLPRQVRLLRQANRGPGAARNLGIKNAKGDYLAFLDVDDLWPEETLSTLSRYLTDHTELDVVRGYAQLLILDEATGRYRDFADPRESFADYISAGLYRRSAFSTLGPFDQTLYFGEDSDWYDRLRESELSMRTLDLLTLFVRRHGANMTRDKNPSELHKTRTIRNHLEGVRAKP